MKRIVLVLLCIGMLATACKSGSEKLIKQADAHRSLGEAYILDGNYTAALRELMETVKMNPRDHVAYNDIGLVYLRREKLPEALESFKKALSLKPDYGDAMLNLAVTYLQMNQWDLAIEHLKTLESDMLYAGYQSTLLNLGYAYFMKGDYANASAHYENAIRHYEDGFPKDATYVMALLGQARVYLKSGKARSALTLIDKALVEAPQVPELHFYRGNALELLGDRPAARNAYLKVIELAPQGALSKKAVAALRAMAG